MPKQKIYFIGTLISVLLLTSVARAEVSEETAYILNTFLFLVMGFLVMWMAAGLEINYLLLVLLFIKK